MSAVWEAPLTPSAYGFSWRLYAQVPPPCGASPHRVKPQLRNHTVYGINIEAHRISQHQLEGRGSLHHPKYPHASQRSTFKVAFSRDNSHACRVNALCLPAQAVNVCKKLQEL